MISLNKLCYESFLNFHHTNALLATKRGIIFRNYNETYLWEKKPYQVKGSEFLIAFNQRPDDKDRFILFGRPKYCLKHFCA